MKRVKEFGVIVEAFEREVGALLLVAPFIAKHVGHKHPLRSTVKGYRAIDPDAPRAQQLATEYVVDLLSMKTDEILAKWHPEALRDPFVVSGMIDCGLGS